MSLEYVGNSYVSASPRWRALRKVEVAGERKWASMLQIIAGKFFGNGERYEFEGKGIAYSNMSWGRSIERYVGMQDFLKKKLLNSDDGRGVHIDKDEVETVGAHMGLDPDQAAQLFESIGGDHWWGQYVVPSERRWIRTLVENVR